MEKAAIVHAVQRWEHLCMTRRSANYLVDDMNKEGQNGWELVSVLHYKDPKGIMAWTAFLKRPAVHPALAASTDQKESSPEPARQPEKTEPKKTEPPDQPSGFDLNGDEFTLHEEPLEEAEPEGKQKAKGE